MSDIFTRQQTEPSQWLGLEVEQEYLDLSKPLKPTDKSQTPQTMEFVNNVLDKIKRGIESSTESKVSISVVRLGEAGRYVQFYFNDPDHDPKLNILL